MTVGYAYFSRDLYIPLGIYRFLWDIYIPVGIYIYIPMGIYIYIYIYYCGVYIPVGYIYI